jgi:hypothetical protein
MLAPMHAASPAIASEAIVASLCSPICPLMVLH